MIAIRIANLNGPEAMEVVDVPDPIAALGEVLIQVKAAGVSFPELLQTRGKYQIQPNLPFIPGSEMAGTVLSAPPESQFSPGDDVVGFCSSGAFAERAVAPANSIFRLPGGYSFEEGAALPLNYSTSLFALAWRGRLTPGESVLVHGAGGGVGTAAIQVAKALGARRVFGVASTPLKRSLAMRAGAEDCYTPEEFRDAVMQATDGAGVDVVVDPVGGDRFADSVRVLASGGRLLVVGFTSGDIPSVQVNRLLLRNVDVVGVAWGAFARAHPEARGVVWTRLSPMFESGALAPIVGASFSLRDAKEALLSIEQRRATGKTVLLTSPTSSVS